MAWILSFESHDKPFKTFYLKLSGKMLKGEKTGREEERKGERFVT